MEIEGYKEIMPGEVYARNRQVISDSGDYIMVTKNAPPITDIILLSRYASPQGEDLEDLIEEIVLEAKEAAKRPELNTPGLPDNLQIESGNPIQSMLFTLPYAAVKNISLKQERYIDLLKNNLPKGNILIEYGRLPNNIAETLEGKGSGFGMYHAVAESISEKTGGKLGLVAGLPITLHDNQLVPKEELLQKIQFGRASQGIANEILKAVSGLYTGGIAQIPDSSCFDQKGIEITAVKTLRAAKRALVEEERARKNDIKLNLSPEEKAK